MFDELADRSPSGPDIVQALRNLARLWRECADLIGEPVPPPAASDE